MKRFGSTRKTILGLAVSLDIIRSTGVVPALQRVQHDARGRRLMHVARRRLYARIWQEAANEIGAQVVELGCGFFEIRRNGAFTRVREQHVQLDDVVTARLALDKKVVYGLLSSAEIPVPAHVELAPTELRRGVEFLRERGRPCVVKPADATSGGSATTAGITTESDLYRAFLRCSRRNDRLLLEEEARGIVYRLLFLDGCLIGALRRYRPRVRGDGGSTIRQLIAAENRRRLANGGEAGLDLIRVDLDCVVLLRRSGLRLSSVLPPGELAAIKTVTNQNSVEDNETIHDELAPELVAEAARAADAVGVRLAGVDVVTPDPRLSLAESGGVVIEVNTGPGLHHHYLVRDRPRHERVAVPILRALLLAPQRHEQLDAGAPTLRR